MKRGHYLSNMLIIATQRHDGQFDRGGNPYILHPLKVMHYLRSDDEELQCVAIGHDLFEDTFKSVDEGISFLRSRGFSERIIDGIVALTKIEGEPIDSYKARVKSNLDAVRVKLCDLRHNSDIRRLKGIGQKDIERMVSYHTFYLELVEHLRVTETQAASDEIQKLRGALGRIERWQGEFPETGRYWDEPNTNDPMSYGTCFGSDGERDYMRQIARQALTETLSDEGIYDDGTA